MRAKKSWDKTFKKQKSRDGECYWWTLIQKQLFTSILQNNPFENCV